MTRFAVRMLPIALAVLAAACSSEPPPQAEAAAETAKAPQKPANPLPTNPTPRAAPVSNADPAFPAPKPGDIRQFMRFGNVECDSFIEKARLCLNSGLFAEDARRELHRELRRGIDAARTKSGDDVINACLNMQAALQPKLIAGGCQNL